jgi:PAS domain S-box-containing protein
MWSGDSMLELVRVSSRTRERLQIYLALPLTYVLIGRAGLLLAVPPGYATAVFLPAGIAVGAAFMAGASALPGVFLGSLLLNIWVGVALTHQIDPTSAVTAAIIALASMLQAALGGAVLRRVIRYPASLDAPRELASFLLLAPVFCLTSATLSLGGTWALGVVPAADLPINWLTWWTGDTLGVLVALPLMLVLAGEPRAVWRRRAWSVAAPMVLCFSLFVAIFVRVNQWENEAALLEFRLQSQHVAQTIKSNFDEQTLFLSQLSGVFASRVEPLTRRDFHDLAQNLLQRFPSIQAVEWAPRVGAAERKVFEAAQGADVAGFTIRERNAADKLTAASPRDAYYPVTYVEPPSGNEAAVGFDLASDEARRAAIEAAIASGRPVATMPIRLVQERGRQSGTLLVQAVTGGPAGPGVVLVALRPGAFLGALVEPLGAVLHLRFVDAAQSRPLFDTFPASAPAANETSFEFGTRHYLVQTAPTAAYLTAHRGWQSWAVLTAGVLSTGLLGALLMLGSGHAHRIETHAEQLRARERELQTIIDRTPFMLVRCSREMRYLFVSEAYAQMLGRRPDEFVGKPIVEILGSDGFNAMEPYIRKVLQGERVEYENEVEYPNVGKRELYRVYLPEHDELGNVTGWVASIRDITQQKRAVAAERMLVRELEHRTNNLLAVIQAIAYKTLAAPASLDEAKIAFESRLQALARAHRQLTKSNWSGVDLGEIVRLALAPFATRTEIDGPSVMVGAKDAQNFTLAVHELATNAVKHGALANTAGQIGISWAVAMEDGGNVLRFRWRERGGPAPAAPSRHGFGTTLLRATFETITFDYAPVGFTCEITVRLGNVELGTQAPPLFDHEPAAPAS